jgi:hypothetical protein
MTRRRAQDELFGDAAVRLCGTVASLLGWRPKELWECTPMELAAALSFAESAVDGPNAETIHALRKRFPDKGG